MTIEKFSNRLKNYLLIISLFILGLFSQLVLAVSNNVDGNKAIFYIGVEDKRIPYSYLGEDKKPMGILIDQVKTLCHHLDTKCHFVTGEMEHLLSKLRARELNFILIQDFFILPKIDKIILTPPICNIKPVFLQKKLAKLKVKAKDFKGKIIGVQRASLLHLYLLENYNSFATLKPYIQLESAVFDLISGRIDALFADEAFIKKRVLTTSFGESGNPLALISLNIETVKITKPTMRLAFREDDKKIMQQIKNILDQSKIESCSNLLKNSEDTTPNKPSKNIGG